jgi:hypothetical protein
VTWRRAEKTAIRIFPPQRHRGTEENLAFGIRFFARKKNT